MIERSAVPNEGLIAVVAVAELFAVSGSAGLPVTEAVLLIDPGVAGTVTVIVRTSDAPLASAPIVHVTVPALFTHPGEADPNTAPAGSVSVAVTPVAAAGPLLVIVNV